MHRDVERKGSDILRKELGSLCLLTEVYEVNKLSFILETGCICNMADKLMEKQIQNARGFLYLTVIRTVVTKASWPEAHKNSYRHN